jgi:von Willebrand factor type A domain
VYFIKTMSTFTKSTIQSVLQFTPPGAILPVDFADSPEHQFGILEISTLEKDALPHTWDVKFDVDFSGSMSELCIDGRDKLQHIKHVLANILRLFASYSHITFNVSVDAFDDTILHIFDFVQITTENVEEYIAKINTIQPRGQTNLVLPLKTTKEQMAKRLAAFPKNRRLHFLLTDGNDTCHNSSKTIMNTVDVQYHTIVFGFGKDHDSKTLMAIGEKPFCEYAFIAEMEKAGIVYGEYIHNVLYRCIDGLVVLLKNAEIYCWKTNKWSSTLDIGNIASGLKKSYYVRTTGDIYSVCGEIHGRECSLDYGAAEFKKLDEFETMPHLVSENGEIDAIQFKDHSLRLKTLELLYEVAHLDDFDTDNTTNGNDDHEHYHDDEHEHEHLAEPSQQPLYILPPSLLHPKKSEKNNVKVNEIKKKLVSLYRTIRDYKAATENQFLASLMDDLYIARRSFDSHNGHLYTLARQRTQGTQNVYTPSNIDNFQAPAIKRHRRNNTPTNLYDYEEYTLNTPRLTATLQPPSPFTFEEGDEDEDILNHHISGGTQKNYSTPRMLDIIRSTSDQVGDDAV